MYQQPQPQQPYQPVPPPAVPPKKTAPTWLIAVVAGVLGLCCVGGVFAVVASNPDTPDAAPASSPEPSETPAREVAEPEPGFVEPVRDGTVSGTCDLLLFVEGYESDFAASIDVTNTGNVGIVVTVTASFDQLGQDDYVLSDEVRVEVGETETVHLNERIDGTTVDRHQNGGYDCRIDGEITDSFGTVQS